MLKTKLDISGTSALIDGVAKYRLDFACLERGELPDRNIFLFQVVDPTNPSEDSFEGVVEPSDFGLYSDDRNAVTVTRGKYRTSIASRLYDNVEVADAAKRALKDYVNKLVSDYIVYRDSIATSEQVDFPWTTPDKITELKNVYLEAYADYQTAVTAYTSATTAFEAAETTYSKYNTEYETWAEIAPNTNLAYTQFSTLINAIKTEPGISEHPNLLSNAQTTEAVLTTFATTNLQIQENKNTAQANRTAALQDVATKTTELYQAYGTCKQKYDVAKVALVAVKDYDPEWYNEKLIELGSEPQPPQS